MVELLAFAPIHLSATVHRSSSQVVLRALIGLTFILSSDGAILSADPEAPDDDDLAWLSRLDPTPTVASCTARASPWRLRLASGELEVDKSHEPAISPADWTSATIEVGDQWLSVPTIRPLVTLGRSGARELAKLCRVDFARWRDRLRTLWRYERVLSEGERLSDVMVETSEGTTPIVPLASRPPPSSREIARITADELLLSMPLEDTVSLDEPRPSEPLPFAPPRQEAPEIRAPSLEDPPTIANVPETPPRRTIGEVLAAQRPVSSKAPPPSELPPDLGALEPSTTPKRPRVDVLWWERSAAKRARRQPSLASHLPKVRWASRGSEEVEQRHRRDLEGLLRHAATVPLERALARHDDEEEGESEDADRMFVVAGDFVPELDDVALLSATVGGAFSFRAQTSIDEVAAEAERILTGATLEQAPFLASSAARKILDAVKSGVSEKASLRLEQDAKLAALRARRFATRTLFGERYMRARISDGGASSVAYLSVIAADVIPLLLSLRVRVLARALPPQEEGDTASCLVVDVLGREA